MSIQRTSSQPPAPIRFAHNAHDHAWLMLVTDGLRTRFDSRAFQHEDDPALSLAVYQYQYRGSQVSLVWAPVRLAGCEVDHRRQPERTRA